MNPLSQLRDLSRADFLRSVGLYLQSDRVVLARLRKSFLDVGVVELEERAFSQEGSRQSLAELTGWVADDVKEIALKAEAEARERDLRQALLSLLPHLNALRDAVYVCVAPDQVMVQQIFLPLAAAENLQQVLDYEIERQLPFKREDIYYDFLPAAKKGEKLCVYVFAIPKKQMDWLLAVLESFGIKPAGVESTTTALANYLLYCQGDQKGNAAVVAGHGKNWEMIALRRAAAAWNSKPELLLAHRLPVSPWAAGPGKELLRQCLSLSPKLYRCGDLSALNGAADSGLGQSEDLVALGRSRLRGGEAVVNAEAVPAIGAALRGVREAPLAANLLRHEGEEQGGRRALSLVNSLLLGVFVLALLAWAVSFPIKDEIRLRQLQNENLKLEPAVQALRAEETELRQLEKVVAYIDEFERRRGETLRVLDELSRILPATAYVTSLRFRAGVLEIQGSADNASALIPLLERSPFFENVAFNAPSNRGRDNRETYSLKAELEKQAGARAAALPPPAAKESAKEGAAKP